MSKTLYIVAGWEDTGEEEAYQTLKKLAGAKNYQVFIKSIDWKKPLSKQIFKAEPQSTIFGFSLGAVLGWMVAQKYSVEYLILASMTPRHNFTDPEILKDFYDLCGREFVDDIKANLSETHKAEKQTILYGEKEEEPGDILIPETEHELTKNYLEEIKKLL
ncbi:MAG TPA: hypothetical protein VFM02_03455 [Candidatus Paceibacterota bacterium]|nr:hypothetical protein [Candidatus Paceibacterota bacterium]